MGIGTFARSTAAERVAVRRFLSVPGSPKMSSSFSLSFSAAEVRTTWFAFTSRLSSLSSFSSLSAVDFPEGDFFECVLRG